MITLGLDIGSNSVGSAWVDLEQQLVAVASSVFPAGVDEADDKRGAPKNQERRSKRSLRRALARRAKRKRLLRQCLATHGLLPSTDGELKEIHELDPWTLRQKGLDEPLTPHEFGRVLLHLIQRRGAAGLRISDDCEDDNEKDTATNDAEVAKTLSADDAVVYNAIKHTKSEMKKRGARTYGELIALISQERTTAVLDEDGQPKRNDDGTITTFRNAPIRNRADSFEFHAHRALIRNEFLKLWDAQKKFDSPLAILLTDQLKKELDDPEGDATWRHKGLLFGQRRTYWDVGTLGRCQIEPTERCVPIADRHASYYRVIETVNNIKVKGPGDDDYQPLDPMQRDLLIRYLRGEAVQPVSIHTGEEAAKPKRPVKNIQVKHIRELLGIDQKTLEKLDVPVDAYALNIEADEQRELNTDWFYREVILNGLGPELWEKWDERKREGLNRAMLRFDPKEDGEDKKLETVLQRMGLDAETVQRIIAAWGQRPKLERRLKLSRRAIRNLLPYMERQLTNGRWPTQIEARDLFAADEEGLDQSTGQPVNDLQRIRYSIAIEENKMKELIEESNHKYLSKSTRSERHFLSKHPDLLPPAPVLSNPVVRKAVHEVRRHVSAYIRRFGKKPDRIVIEFAREASKPAKISDSILFLNRTREKIRNAIVENVIGNKTADLMTHNQLRAAIDRVVLARQQKHRCAYCGGVISDAAAARGDDVEIDHIIPYSRCGNNSWNNRVLVHTKCNRDKGRRTPREWWGNRFEDMIKPMRFMSDYETKEARPDKGDYFTKRDYVAKWRNLCRETVPQEWRGSQLSDTGYAAREVQEYLHRALWPNDQTHLRGEKRRILVTKGAYTATLRKDWQLYQDLHDPMMSREEVQKAVAKNRGDHREHAIDAVAIALTDGSRIQDLARHAQAQEEARVKGQSIKRRPLPPPWGDVKSFRRQVLSLIYDSFDDMDNDASDGRQHQPMVVSHRPIGRRIIGQLHEETLFGPVPGQPGLFTGRKRVEELTPNHIRQPRHETIDEAVARLTEEYLAAGIAKNRKDAKAKAEKAVKAPSFKPILVDPPPGKSGLVRDRGIRQMVRQQIRERLAAHDIKADVEKFTKKDLATILKDGPLRMPSGVPIKRVTLLRTMKDPVIIARKRWDQATNRMVRDTSPRADRAYVGGNNHHIEIREDDKGQWTGVIVPTYDAARRVRIEKLPTVDRSDDPARGGKFVMSLAEGETVYMKHKDTGKPGYFVVFKLDKPQTIQFKYHWDARRATGEKDQEGKIIPGSIREGIAVSARQFRDLAPPGHDYPVKVHVSPLGEIAPLQAD